MAGDCTTAISAALDWLTVAQLPSGEIPSWAGPTELGVSEWEADRLNFVTALAVEALDEVDDERARRIVDRGVEFLLGERGPSALWQYWARDNERSGFTPADADDTACCSIAVSCRGHRTSANVRVLKAMCSPEGRFHTWLIPRGKWLSPPIAWALRSERSKSTRLLRSELWSSTEADPDDVDAVVNANVCRYLGPSLAPTSAVEWVAGVVASSDDTHDKWHRRPAMLWAAVADGARRGIGQFAKLDHVVESQISQCIERDGGLARDLDTALALFALQAFDLAPSLRDRLARALTDRQSPEGHWARDVVYFGGPTEVFAWASEALVTALAVRSLSAVND